jgi:hypothetical protein
VKEKLREDAERDALSEASWQKRERETGKTRSELIAELMQKTKRGIEARTLP